MSYLGIWGRTLQKDGLTSAQAPEVETPACLGNSEETVWLQQS